MDFKMSTEDIVKLDSVMLSIVESLMRERNQHNRVAREESENAAKSQEKLLKYIEQCKKLLALDDKWVFNDQEVGFVKK